jgi:7-carboxy-7-deazaguanine synthase
MQEILISEIFGPTIQGEGALVGRATVFVRTGGCDFRCSWCDSLYAVLPSYKDTWSKMSGAAVLEQVEKLSGGHPILVTLSGGNPALQPLEELLDLGHDKKHTFAMETQGTKAPLWLSKLDHLVLSPKPPSSEMVFKPELLAECIEVAGDGPQISLKVVVFDEADYQFARQIHALHPTIPFYLSIGNTAPVEEEDLDNRVFAEKLEWLLARCATDGWFSPTILPQLHVLLWGNKRGV